MQRTVDQLKNMTDIVKAFYGTHLHSLAARSGFRTKDLTLFSNDSSIYLVYDRHAMTEWAAGPLLSTCTSLKEASGSLFQRSRSEFSNMYVGIVDGRVGKSTQLFLSNVLFSTDLQTKAISANW